MATATDAAHTAHHAPHQHDGHHDRAAHFIEQPHIHDLLAQETSDKMYFSFEFFPPKTEKGEENLRQRLSDYARQHPVFIDFTWGAGGTTSEQTPRWIKYVAHELHIPANMHLTCTNMPQGKVHEALEFCKLHGIRNIVALRGDPPAGQEWKASADGFASGLDLVKYIRANYGDYFSITVAGYPEGHPDVIPKDGLCSADEMGKEVAYLKLKVEAGANLIITQLFYNVEHFKLFTSRCRAAGITVPILPGILPMQSYAGLQRMVGICKTDMPPEVVARTEALKDDEVAFKAYGVELATKMCKELYELGVRHFHFYTLNQEAPTFAVLNNLGIFHQDATHSQSQSHA